MKEIQAQFPWRLMCDYWSSDGSSSEEGSITLPPVPLSFLVKVFGPQLAAPWFNDGLLIDSRVASVFPQCLIREFDFTCYKYRMRLYGDGKARLTRENVAFGLTAYEGQKFEYTNLMLIGAEKLLNIEKLYEEERVDKDCRPTSILVDEEWFETFLSPVGISKNLFDSRSLIYFDVWFGF